MTNQEYEEYLERQFQKFTRKVDEVFAKKGDVSFPDVEDFLVYANEKVGIEDTSVGSLLPMMSNEAPPHYLVCDGTEYPIGSYPYLEQHFTEKMGRVNFFGGDGTNTFAVPKLQGEFIRGAGTNKYENQGSGGEVGEHQDGSTFPTGYLTASNGNIYIKGSGVEYRRNNADFWYPNSGSTNVFYPTTKESEPYPGGIGIMSSRPTNTSVLFCIKYEPTYCINIEGTGSGTTDYEKLENLPSINDVELKGNMTLEDIGAQPAEFIGTMAKFEESLADGKIKEGMLINITDDGESSVLSEAVIKRIFLLDMEYVSLPSKQYGSGVNLTNQSFIGDGKYFDTDGRCLIPGIYFFQYHAFGSNVSGTPSLIVLYVDGRPHQSFGWNGIVQANVNVSFVKKLQIGDLLTPFGIYTVKQQADAVFAEFLLLARF